MVAHSVASVVVIAVMTAANCPHSSVPSPV